MKRGKNPYTGDPRTREAKAQGYPARSVFKLQEIDRRFGLLKPGSNVLDLGAAPGSWSLYAAKCVGEKGRVTAIDLAATEVQWPPQVEAIVSDIFEMDVDALRARGPFDVVLSDMAPNTSGQKSLDQARSHELAMQALELARLLGRPKSHFVAKIFMGPDFEQAKRALMTSFTKHAVVRPRGTRSNSTELFLVGVGLKT